MNIQEYLSKKENFQAKLLEYFDDDTQTIDQFAIFFDYISDMKIIQNKGELKLLLHLLLQLANNHHRGPQFFKKLDDLLQQLSDTIKQTFSNREIFELFESNKRLLLFLIENGSLTIDSDIFSVIADESFQRKDYLCYFWPEVEIFANDEQRNRQEEAVTTSSRHFEVLRLAGENESEVAEIIRRDSVDDFIAYEKQATVYKSGSIHASPFETNFFLVAKSPTILEYAAFCGAHRIFHHLRKSGYEATSSVWMFAVHGRSIEIIQSLEESCVVPEDATYIECFIEAVKCHHNEVALHIRDKFINGKEMKEEEEFNITSKIVQSLNFELFPKDLSCASAFYNLCQFNFAPIVEVVLQNAVFDVNRKITQTNLSGVSIIQNKIF